MAVIFLKISGKLEDIGPKVFASIGIKDYQESDSLNVLGGTYYQCGALGYTIKLEQNSYDKEEEYEYTLFVKKDVLNNIFVEDFTEDLIVQIITSLMQNNLNVRFEVEK